MATHSKFILLDRDGVINENLPLSVLRVDRFKFIPQSLEALRLLKEAGVKVAICTNQSCVGRGRITADELNAIHQYMCDTIIKNGGEIAKIYAALDHPDNASDRRKPGAGMLLQALSDFGATAAETTFIGDNITDLQAAKSAGCKRVLVRTGHGEEMEKNGFGNELQPISIYNNLFDAVTHYLS